MLDEFRIRRFRAFSEFSLSGLKRVNLFVGRNNAGKSSLLEALYLYASRMDFDALQSLAAKRGEFAVDSMRRDPFGPDLSHFFHGHKIKNGRSFEIGTSKLMYEVKAELSTEMIEQLLLPSEHDDVDVSRRALFSLKAIRRLGNGEKDDEILQEASLSAVGTVLGYRRNSPFGIPRKSRNNFISPDSLDNRALAAMWNDVLVSNSENAIVNALRLLDDRVSSVAFLLSEQSTMRYPQRPSAGIVIGMDGATGRLPLGSLGDGMKRLLSIAVALSCSQGGALFIDEIDAGFHYSVMRDLWRLIINTAIANKVQVFATTHSLDCIRGLSVIAEETILKDSLSLYSINAQALHATHYRAEEVAKIIEHEIEVRQ